MISPTRLKIYPRLILLTVWGVMLFNLVFGDVFIGYDYLIFYTAGILYQTNPIQLYNPQALSNLSELVLANTNSSLRNVYLNPPYFAFLFTLINRIPYLFSFIGWSLLSIAALLGSFYIMSKHLLPEHLKEAGLSFVQLAVIGFSLFPAVYGLQSGQNHTFTLLFLTLVVWLCKRERWVEAGFVGGLLIYKPQYVVIFLVIWIIWRRYKALAGFGTVATTSILAVVIPNGWGPFGNYLQTLQYVWLYPFDEVGKIEMSVYALFAFFLNPQNLDLLILVSYALCLSALILTIVLAVRCPPSSWQSMIPPLLVGILFPFFASPHILFYELEGLVLLFVLWGNVSRSKLLYWTAISAYISSLFLPLIAVTTGIPAMSIIPLGVSCLVAIDAYTSPRSLRGEPRPGHK